MLFTSAPQSQVLVDHQQSYFVDDNSQIGDILSAAFQHLDEARMGKVKEGVEIQFIQSGYVAAQRRLVKHQIKNFCKAERRVALQDWDERVTAEVITARIFKPYYGQPLLKLGLPTRVKY